MLQGDNWEAPPRPLGLVFLNACRTATPAQAGSFLDAAYASGLYGLIATENFTVDTVANPFGLDFLEAFVYGGEPVGKLLRRLPGGGVPLGLLYAAYCPPDITARARKADGEPGSDVSAPPKMDVPPPPRPAGTPERLPLPAHPYRSLAYYRREERALFAGRD